MENYRYWVFDLDGTLTVHQHDFAGFSAELGIPPGCLILEYLEGLEARQAAALRARLHAMEVALVREAVLAAGAREVIDMLKSRHARFGILTRNTRSNALATLQAIGLSQDFPDAYVLGREDLAPKPAADGIAHLLDLWQGKLEECVMVGDFRLDLEAGRNARVATAHVAPDGADAWPALTDHRFTSLIELHAAIKQAG
jgi:phosphoglycolate phosphatase-like HAD superfamily hydrolase